MAYLDKVPVILIPGSPTSENLPLLLADNSSSNNQSYLKIHAAGLYWNPSTQILTVGSSASSGVVINGDLTVNGTTTTFNSTILTIDDINIILGNIDTPTDITADGGGITLKGNTDKTFAWVNATDAWTSSEHIALAAGKDLIFNGLTSGYVTLVAADVAGTPVITLPGTTGTLARTADVTYIGTTSVALNRASGGMSLTGISGVTGNSLTLDSDTVGVVALGTGSYSKEILIGNATGTTHIHMTTGTGNLDITSPISTLSGDLVVTGGDISTGAAISSNLFNTTTTGDIKVANGLTTGTLIIGGDSQTGVITLGPSTGAQNINIGAGSASTGTITIGSTTKTVQLPTGTTKIGQTSLVQGGAVSITLPSSAGTLARLTDVTYIGTTSIALNRTSTALALTGITSVKGTTLTLDSDATGAVNIGTSANAKVISIGNGIGATQVYIATGTGNLIIDSPLTSLSGNLIVNGTGNINIAGSKIVFNKDATGDHIGETNTISPSNAIIEVERGTAANVYIKWDETSMRWGFTNNGTDWMNFIDVADIQALSTSYGEFTITADSTYTWDDTTMTAPGAGENVNLIPGTGIDLSIDSAKSAIRFTHTDTSTLTGAQGTAGIASFTLDGMGHVTAVTTATYLTSQTSSKNIVGASGTAIANATATNGNVYLNHLENTTVTSAHNIIGSGLVSVTSDASGNITITGTHTSYTYSAPTAGTETVLTDITLIDSLTVTTNGHITGGTYRKLVAGSNVSLTAASNGNITIASTDNDTHYASLTIVGASAAATANAAATDGNVWLNHIENSAVVSAHNIIGANGATVVSDSAGKITITSPTHTYAQVATSLTGAATAPSNGQLLIGDGTDYTRATLTAGTGISITNAAGSITIKTVNGILEKSAAYTLLQADSNSIVLCTMAAVNYSITLPTAPTIGTTYTIKKVDTGVGILTIDAGAGSTIDGAQTFALPYQYQSIDVIYVKASTWFIV